MSPLRSLLSLTAIALVGACTEYDLADKGGVNELPDDAETPDAVADADVSPGVGGVEGRICAPDDATMVAGATVSVELGDGTLVTTTTDGDGHFLLEGLPAGTYTVRVEKGSFHTEFEVVVAEGEITNLAYQECLSGDDVAIAVVIGQYDSIQVVLDRLNLDYTAIDGVSGSAHVDLLRDPAQLDQYDIIFFNCGMNDAWMPFRAQIGENLRDYVRNGGSVYTSDWSYYLAETAYPDLLEFKGDDHAWGSAMLGVAGEVSGDVLDASMVAALGTERADLFYDLDVWSTPDSVGNGTELIRGSYGYYVDPFTDDAALIGSGPLAARRVDGDGELIFTTFHNEQQTTAQMDILLQEMILSL